MCEYVGLRSKTYAYLLREEGKEHVLRSKAKGVTKGYKKTLDFQHFKKCIETYATTVVHQYHIRSTNHVVKTLKVKKTAFGSYDDKRRILNCGIHSLAYGSKFIKANNDECTFC
jgi:hypothetical protein